MDLTQLLEKYPNINEASTADNQDALAFFSRAPMRTSGFELVYDRTPDFSALLRAQGPGHRTFLSRKTTGELQGVASMSWSRRWVNGHLESVGYLGDLRASRDRRLAVDWRKFYGEFLEVARTSEECGRCQHLFTAIMAGNEEAQRNFVNPARRSLPFRYEHFKRVDMVNVFGRKRWRSRTTPWTATRVTDTSEVRRWIARRKQRATFGSDFSSSEGNEWSRRLQNWPGLREDQLFVVRDEQSRIRLAAWPWSPSSMKRMKLNAMSLRLRFLNPALRFFGLKGPKVGADLHVVYLTSLTFAENMDSAGRQHALEALIAEIAKAPEFKDNHMISFCDQWNLTEFSKTHFAQRTGIDLYTVGRAGEVSGLDPKAEVDFEMAVV